MAKLVVGCGYLGWRVATRWRDRGHAVAAVTRDAIRAQRMRHDGLTPIVADITRPESFSGVEWPAIDSVLFAVGYDRASGQPIYQVYVEGLRHLLAVLPAGVTRFIYISSTGVYGDFDGEWVDEDSPCQPRREGGRACLAAERLLAEHPRGRRAIILRLAGVYGPGRVPRRESIVAGQPVPAAADGYVNLIHVDDAAGVVLAAEAATLAPRTYIVSDGRPVRRGEYFREMARLLNAPEPAFVAPAADSHAAARASADKRVSNARMMAELAPTLSYPSYREGLASILSAAPSAPIAPV